MPGNERMVKPCRSGGLALFFCDMKSTLLEQCGEGGDQNCLIVEHADEIQTGHGFILNSGNRIF